MTLNCIWLWRSSFVVWGMWSSASLPLLSGPLWPGVAVKDPSVGQIELVNLLLEIIISYLKPYSYEQVACIR